MSMGAPACDVIPRTEGLLEGEGGSRGKGGRVEGRYTPTVPWHWWTPATGLASTLHGASQPITCSKQPQGLDRLCGWSLRERC